MSESMTCGQQIAYNATREVVDTAVAPIHGIIADLRRVLYTLVEFAAKLREGFRRVRDLYREVMTTIEKSTDWLKVRGWGALL